MIPVTINDKQQYNLPENWNELTGKQLCAIAPYLFMKEIDLQQRSVIACKLLQLDYRVLKSANDFLSLELINKILPLVSWMFEDITLTAQLLPVIDIPKHFMFFGSTKLYGPTANFNNLCIAEFSDTEFCLTEYQKTKEEKWLNLFIAILYRPKQKGIDTAAANYAGDIRQAYNFHLNDFIAVMVSKLDTNLKMAIMLWYLGCRAELVKDYKFLFSDGNKKATAEGGSWTDVIHGLAGPKFGTVEQTMSANLKVVLKELSILHHQAAELAANNPV